MHFVRAIPSRPSAAYLDEMVLLSVRGATSHALREVIIALPAVGPLIYSHDLVTVTDGWINLHGITCRDARAAKISVSVGGGRRIALYGEQEAMVALLPLRHMVM